jgi:hypothetical protein
MVNLSQSYQVTTSYACLAPTHLATLNSALLLPSIITPSNAKLRLRLYEHRPRMSPTCQKQEVAPRKQGRCHHLSTSTRWAQIQEVKSIIGHRCQARCKSKEQLWLPTTTTTLQQALHWRSCIDSTWTAQTVSNRCQMDNLKRGQAHEDRGLVWPRQVSKTTPPRRLQHWWHRCRLSKTQIRLSTKEGRGPTTTSPTGRVTSTSRCRYKDNTSTFGSWSHHATAGPTFGCCNHHLQSPRHRRADY